MKKVLVATCVVAMTAFGITNASAQTSATVQNAQSTRASAFGVELSLLGEELIDRTGEAESILPPGGPIEDDILSVGDPGSLVLSFTGRVLADTRFEPTIRPILNPENEEARGGSSEGSGLLGGDIINDILGEDGEGFLGGGGDGGGGGGGGILSRSTGQPGAVQAQQLGGDGGDGGDSLLGGDGGDGLLGGILGESGEDEEGNQDPDIQLPVANAQGYAVVENLGVANDDLEGDLLGAGLTETAAAALADALLKVEAVQAEAVALCTSDGPVFDTASRILDLNNDNVDLVDDLVDSLSDILPGVIEVNETGRTADGGVFVNALRVTIGGDDFLGGDGGDSLLGGDGGTTDGGTTDGGTTDGGTTDGDSLLGGDGGTTDGDSLLGGDGGTASFQANQLGGGDGEGEDDAILDIILGHAEVSGATVCAQQVAPPPFVPAGDERTLPVTGGGLGALPVVLGLGLVAAAVGAGRLALRSRREHTL